MKVENVRAGAKAPQAPKADAKTPSIISVKGKDGRTYGLKKLKPSDRYLLSKVMDLPNMSTLMQAISVASVFSIDDEAYTPITSEKEFLVRIDEIGDDGLEAITGPCMEMYGTQITIAEADTAKN